MSLMIVCNFPENWLKPRTRSPISSLLFVLILFVKSAFPFAISVTASFTISIGVTIVCEMMIEIAIPKMRPTSEKIRIIFTALWMSCRSSLRGPTVTNIQPLSFESALAAKYCPFPSSGRKNVEPSFMSP